ncbi:MAG: hypothetical protein ABSF47_03775 [Minisyncoccia bacterium]|jgi:hypothetical protein
MLGVNQGVPQDDVDIAQRETAGIIMMSSQHVLEREDEDGLFVSVRGRHEGFGWEIGYGGKTPRKSAG